MPNLSSLSIYDLVIFTIVLNLKNNEKRLKMKQIHLLSLLMAFIAISCTCSSSSEINQRKQLFDFDWKFKLGDHPEASKIAFNDKDWRNLDLPHDWSIEGDLNPDNPTGNDGGYFPAGLGWYRKTFKAPKDWADKKVGIYFEGVYMNAEVFINGESLGIRPYGYSSFFYDLTPYIKTGQNNTIAVKVDNSQQKNCRWYSGSGIYRHVWLSVKNPVHIEQWGVQVTTPEVSKEKATVEVKTNISNNTDKEQELTIQAQLKGKGSDTFNNEIIVKLAPQSSNVFSQKITVENPSLWSPENPNLYSADIQILNQGEVLDQTEKTFGIRSISYSTDKGFQLNGETVLINGGCAHHDNGSLGAAAYDRAEYKKVELLKAAGFNSVRTSHNPPSEAFLDACDEIGMLVIDESFDGWRTQKTPFDYAMVFDEWAVKDVQDMVLRDFNHPSIIMWSIGNEIIERKEPQAVKTAKLLSDAVKEIDTTRAVTSAMTAWDPEWDIFDPLMAEHDVCGYNYQMHQSESDHERVPSRIIVQTESYPRDAFYNWNMVQSHSYIIGDYVWTALDYLGESGIGRYYYPGEPDGEHWTRNFYPWHGAYCGDIDLIGQRKPISHYRDMLYNPSKKLYMAVKEPNPEGGVIKETMWSVWPTWESWNWPGYEGKDIQVEIYSRYASVKLYLDDQLIGEKATTIKEEFKAVFDVPFKEGTLKAVGVENGEDKETFILKSAGETALIKLEADRSTIKADGQDLAYITIKLTDKDGIVQPNAEDELIFDVEGEGVIVAVDNANLKDTSSYVANTRKAWKGKALVIVKSTRKAGDFTLKVSAPQLKETAITVKTE